MPPPLYTMRPESVLLSAPFGDVVLEYSDRPIVLASAGIGITPMAGMLSHLVKDGSTRTTVLFHADHSEETFALRNQVTEDLAKLQYGSMAVWYEEPGHRTQEVEGVKVGYMDLADTELPADAEFYLCGPLVFMKAVRTALIARGIPAKDIQYEVFGPDLWLADFE